ncbi:MAG TPA: peptidoglycan-binding domain-containing protein [Nitrososphaera sp.]|jgi:hypothetical protein
MKTYCVTNPPHRADEVKRLQKALQAAELYNGPIDGIFGGATGNACYRAKYRLGYADDKLNQCGGQQLLNYLTGAKELPDDYKERRQERMKQVDEHQAIRDKILGYMKWAVANEPSIHYTQMRPMDKLRSPQTLPWYTDCSEFVTTLYCWAGAPDPNGLNYNGQGYTGTLLDHGISIAIYNAKVGDVVVWGSWPGHHTALIYSVNDRNDPDICSHGSDSGPKVLSMSVETAVQGRFGHGSYTVKRYL